MSHCKPLLGQYLENIACITVLLLPVVTMRSPTNMKSYVRYRLINGRHYPDLFTDSAALLVARVM